MNAQAATTQWSQVLAARDGTDTQARQALEALCQTYWHSLYAYVRHQGYSPEESQDLTQGFFAEFIEKDLLAEVDPAKGRFRTYLLVLMRHFLSHERRREQALKRGGGTKTLSFDAVEGETWYAAPGNESMTPDQVFEHRWAMTVFDRAMARLDSDSREAGSWQQFVRLRPYLTGDAHQLPYGAVARELGMSEGAVRVAVYRLRKRLGHCLRAEVADTVASPAEVDDEVRHLLAVVEP